MTYQHLPEMSSNYKYLFGPVISRRYGRSLGVDMVPCKTCSFNCIFCQLGDTARTVTTPCDNPACEAVLAELKLWLASGDETDVITLAGSGEPTLHRHFGRVLTFIKESTGYPSLLLSNGSLFFREDVRSQAAIADIVKLSLHSWDQESFQRITRADSSLDFLEILEGYRRFREIYRGRIDLEIFVLPGINDTPEQMRLIAERARTFSPDSIFLNSAVRPPAESIVKTASPEHIKELSCVFGEIATNPPSRPEPAKRPYSDSYITQLIARHPVPVSHLADRFTLDHSEFFRNLDRMKNQGLICLRTMNGETFVVLNDHPV